MNDLILSLLPVIIFFARILDVSIGTIRIVFISKGYKKIVPLLGFIEVLIWILVVGKLMGAEGIGIIHYISYALGFATGNFVGIFIEEKLSMGDLMIRIFISKDEDKFKDLLNKKNLKYTIVDGVGREGKVKIFFLIIERKKTKEFIKSLKQLDQKVFYTIEDVKESSLKEVKAKKNIKRVFGRYRREK